MGSFRETYYGAFVACNLQVTFKNSSTLPLNVLVIF